MLSASHARVKAVSIAIVALLGIGGAGCYWYRYGDLMETHLELLGSMVGKLCAQPGGGPVAGAAAVEYRYPLQRARDFARVAAKRCPERHSLAAFARVLAHYEWMLGQAAKRRERGCEGRWRLDRRIERVRKHLAREPASCV